MQIKQIFFRSLIAGLLLSGSMADLQAQTTSENGKQLAFPGAAGWGRFATGGRTGSVYHVTNLKDSGTGSLRDAISQSNRIIVFDVAGVIKITDRLVFKSNQYIAGQTAPGEGITVYGNGVSFSGANNIIVRHMRFRMGHGGSSGKDAAGIANGHDMIFDHCSFSWGLDETFSINPDGKGTTPQKITISNSIMGQGLMTHSAGGLMQSDSITLYRNLYCDNATRNNKVKGINQYVNNIVYNWKNGCYIMGGDSEGNSWCNIESNLFINGPANGGNAFSGGGGTGNFYFYGNDNWQDSNMDGTFDPYEVTYYAAGVRQDTPFDYPALEKYEGKTLLEKLLPTVGASLPYRDYADYYMIDEVNSLGKSGALISNEESLVYGAPSTWTVWGGNNRVDSDNDGMPDAWETANGLNPNDATDAMTIAANGYANIENYINGITVDDRDYFLRAPLALEQTASTTSSIKMAWRDYTYEEDGFIIEMKKNGESEWKEMARTGANISSYTISGLENGTQYVVRVRAFADSDKYSDYTSEVSMATRPIETDLVDIDSYEPDLTWDNTATTWDTTAPSWNNGQNAFTDNSKVLFDATGDVKVALPDTVSPAVIVVKGDGNVSISGDGVIAGETSVNKAGDGTLTLGTENTYTGATVLHSGVIELSSLKNGGVASSMGASVNFAQNWIFNGGTYSYTGSSTSTDRAAQVKASSEFDVANSGATVTMNGSFEGKGDLTLGGNGQVTIGSTKFFGYTGKTTLADDITVYLSTTDIAKNGIGSSSKLVMAGGTLKTKGEAKNYETYSFPIEVAEGTTSVFAPNRNCYMNNTITGSGTLQIDIPYVREYVNFDLSNFNGRIIAHGTYNGTDGGTGSLFLLQKGMGTMAKTVIEATGYARICSWATGTSTFKLGGLSGESSTYLSGAGGKSTKNVVTTWNIGSANTDEVFAGKINNWGAGSSSYSGTVNINKVGTGYWKLTGTNDYKGTTTVTGGSLIVNGKNTGTGAVTVLSGATLAGKGSIAGAVTVQSGATLQAGDEDTNGAKLSLGKTLTVKNGGIVSVMANQTTCNTVAMTGAVTLEDGAILQMTDGEFETAPAVGTAYQVFSATSLSVTGYFAEIQPTQPGAGLYWDASALYTEGILKVTNVETGISSVENGGQPVNATYYNLSGAAQQYPSDGVFIMRATMSDGSVVTKKVVK